MGFRGSVRSLFTAFSEQNNSLNLSVNRRIIAILCEETLTVSYFTVLGCITVFPFHCLQVWQMIDAVHCGLCLVWLHSRSSLSKLSTMKRSHSVMIDYCICMLVGLLFGDILCRSIIYLSIYSHCFKVRIWTFSVATTEAFNGSDLTTSFHDQFFTGRDHFRAATTGSVATFWSRPLLGHRWV